MPDIHPTALIDPEVELAPDVYIGPGCVLRGPVKIGPGCKLHGNAYLHGPLTMGANNRVYPFACLGFAAQDLKYDPAKLGAGLVIGDDNVFREGFTAHRATLDKPTRIGNHNYCMATSHVGHDSVLADYVTLVNGALIAGHVEIADRAVIGGAGGVHQFCRVGRLAMTAGGAVITRDLPPFCTVHYSKRVGSLNLVGMRRAGLRQSVNPMRRAFDLFFRSGHSVPKALELIESEVAGDPAVAEFVQFIRTTKRGITRYGGAAGEEE